MPDLKAIDRRIENDFADAEKAIAIGIETIRANIRAPQEIGSGRQDIEDDGWITVYPPLRRGGHHG